MAKRKSPVSLYRLCVVYVSDTIHSLCPADEDIFASAFPLHVSKDLVVQSLKQQNFTSLYHLLKHRLSRDGLRYIEHRLPTAILSRLPRLVRETPALGKHLVELLLVGTMNEDDRRLVEVPGQLPHLRRVTRCPRNVTNRAQVPVAENCRELCKPSFWNQRVADGSFYQLVACQHLLASEMCFDQPVTVWSSFDLLYGLPCQQTAKIPFLAQALHAFSEGCKLNIVEYIARSLVPRLQSSTVLPRIVSSFPLRSRVSLVLTGQENILPLGLLTVFNDRTLGIISANLKLFFLEQAELGLDIVGTGRKTLTLCMFQLYVAASSEHCPFLRNLDLEDLQTLIPSEQPSFLQDAHFRWLERLKFFFNKMNVTKPEQLPWLLRNRDKLTEVCFGLFHLTDTSPEVASGTFTNRHELELIAVRVTQGVEMACGRNLLRTLRLEPSGTMRNEEAWSPIPIKVAAHMQLKPLPRNMNPQRHPGRRKARADYYIRWYRNRDDVLYVDAAVGPLEGTATAAAMTEDGRINISASIKTARPDVAEGVALALAVAHAAADSTITEICTDSQSAYRYFRQGIAPNTVSRILRNIPSLPHPVTITWVPGHECIPGNERVNAHVRGLSIRTLEDHSPNPPLLKHSDFSLLKPSSQLRAL
ncbi:hypothetical protein HPB52_003558 [Rhipicephalus sanguineus]|uniref:RNase H type-1 domain-containing protein n=1 Tax=Rhipicephalus sanguineus TaxID=34632 RepID=A0A9D4QG27_RHISA|nr:hypothetical protein HPB52_003558 [Rhipicephalus sanguineus]